MRTISNALLTAQTEPSGRPYVRVEALDMLAGVARPHFTRLYTGTEASAHHAAAMPADGSLVRARVASGALWVQRVANPGPTSDFSTWTRLDTTSTLCNVAVCSRGVTVLVFFRDAANPRVVNVRESRDSGLTWRTAYAVATLPSGSVDSLAAAFDDAGTPALFLAAGDGSLYVSQRPGDFWSTPAARDYGMSSVSGLACAYDGAWRLAVTGENASGGHRVWSATYDGSWSALLEITRADAGSGVSFAAPFLLPTDVMRLSVVERYTGAGAYHRPLMFNTLAGTPFTANSWRDPVPFAEEAQHGVAMAGSGNAVWLTTPSGVWRGALDASARDLSADVLWLTMRETPAGGAVTIALRNDDARYSGVGTADSPLREGTELRVSPGYATPSGDEVSEGPVFWVTGWERRYGGGEASLVVHAGDGWSLLSTWRARRQFSWARGEAPMASILGYILQRVGLGLESANPSPAMLAHRPAFTIHPGETGATAVRRLLAMAPDLLLFRGRTAFLRLPQPTDAADYAFGSYHAVRQVRIARDGQSATRVQVFGAAGVGEAFEWDAMPLTGERLRQVHDLNQHTLAGARSHAAALLDRLRREAVSGEVLAPPSCGLELHDVVDVYAPGDAASTRLRVAAIELDYRRIGVPKYEQKIALTGL